MSIVKNLIEYIERLEDTSVFSGENEKKIFLQTCSNIKQQVFSQLTDFQKEVLKELDGGNTKNITGVWGDELTEFLELHDLGLCESNEPNVLFISSKGKKLVKSLDL